MTFESVFFCILIDIELAAGGGGGLRERGGGEEKWKEGDELSAPPGGENLNLFEKEIEQKAPPPLGGVFSPTAGE